MKYQVLLLYILFLTNGALLSQTIPVVPHPQKVILLPSTFALPREPRVIYSLGAGEVTEALDETVTECTNKMRGNKSADSTNSEVLISLSGADERVEEFCKANGLSLEDIGEEGYHLVIAQDVIIMVSNTQHGLLYAAHTLNQLLTGCAAEGVLPSLIITDYPLVENRAVMDDISRGPLPNLEFIKSQIRRLSSLKINGMSFYIEHVVKTRNNGSFAPPSALTIEEIRELSDYAAEWNVELIGSFQSLGHFEKILDFPQFRHLGETQRMLKPGDPEALDLLKSIYSEMAPAFSSKYFNINCDEAWDLRRLSDRTPAQGFQDHVVPLLEHVISLGKVPMMWGDMLIQYPEVIDHLPKETIVLTWDYGGHESFAPWIDIFVDKGVQFWVVPGVLNSERLMPNFTTTLKNQEGFVREGFQNGSKGVMNTVWDDGGRHHFSKDWYGIAYGAERCWSPEEVDNESFDKRFDQAFYGQTEFALTGLIDTLLKLGDLPITNSMTNNALGLKLVPDLGEGMQADPESWSQVRAVCLAADSHLQKFQESTSESTDIHWKEDLEFWEFMIDQLLLWSESHMILYDWAKSYDTLCINQTTQPEMVRQQLIALQGNVEALLNRWREQRAEFKSLWFRENREYWFETAAAQYDKNIRDIGDLTQRLGNTAESFDPINGIYLPPPHNVRLDIERVAGKYFTYWLLSEQFAIESYSPPFPDFLVGVGGEASVRPSAFEWKKYQSPVFDRVNLKNYHQRKDKSVAYAYCRVQSDVARRVRATFGSNDGIVVFMNGEKVFSRQEKRSLILDEDEVWIDLKPGTNHLLLKVDQWKSDWAFSFRFPDVKVVSRKYRYYVED